MKPYLFLLPFLSPFLVLASERVVTLGGPITEIVFALGAGDRVVAVDQSSQQPEAATRLPQVGYVGAISTEGLLSVNPSMIIASSRMGPPAAVEQLRSIRIPLHLIANPNSAESLESTIRLIGKALGEEDKAQLLWQKIDRDLISAKEISHNKRAPKVVFIMGNAGIPLAAGRNTQAEGIIHLAGGQNLFPEHTGYKAVSEEALIGLNPDWILVATHNAPAEVNPRDQLRRLGLHNLARDPDRNVHLIDIGSFLNFGPRIGESVSDLANVFFSSDDAD